jgi:putative holliday junction resolvase
MPSSLLGRRRPFLLLLLLTLLLALLPSHAFVSRSVPHPHRHKPATAIGTLWDPPPSPSSSPRPTQNLSAALPDLLGSRTLGLDWGSKKIGVALTAGFSQRPLGTINNPAGHSLNASRHRPTIDYLLGILKAEGAVRVVVGHPLFRDGTLSPQANVTKTFARLVADRALELGIVASADVPFVYLWDERLTSQAAKVNIKTKSFLHSSNDIDSQAACLVLEDFYQHKGYKAEIVWPDPAVMAAKTAAAAAAAAEVAAEAAAAAPALGSEAGSSSSSDGSNAPPPLTRANMTYDEWRRAELARYGRGTSAALPPAGNTDGEGSDDAGIKKKKKKKKKR